MRISTKDLTGREFGLWTANEYLGYQPFGKRGVRRAMWKCSCKCGTTKNLASSYLLIGASYSCGCGVRDAIHKTVRQSAITTATTSPEVASRNLFVRYRVEAKRRNHEFSISYELALSLFKGNCVYCQAPPGHIHYARIADSVFVYNGIDRIDNSLGYVDGNCASCCKPCNQRKSDMTLAEFTKWVDAVYATLHGI